MYSAQVLHEAKVTTIHLNVGFKLLGGTAILYWTTTTDNKNEGGSVELNKGRLSDVGSLSSRVAS